MRVCRIVMKAAWAEMFEPGHVRASLRDCVGAYRLALTAIANQRMRSQRDELAFVLHRRRCTSRRDALHNDFHAAAPGRSVESSPNSTHGLVHLIQVRSASQAEW